MDTISCQEIRAVILAFLDQRLTGNASYKSELSRLDKAQQADDLSAIRQSEQKIAELKSRFDFETWMEDAATRRLFWCDIATNLSKGIHSSSTGSNVNLSLQAKPDCSSYVSSATPNWLPLDCSGNAAALDIFALLNQTLQDKVTLLDLIVAVHPQVLPALSDDPDKAARYLTNIKKVLNDEFDPPKSSELNKQIFWPNSDSTYLSPQQNNYRLLVPLHPSSLCHVVYQKIQTVFSDDNKKAREDRNKKGGSLTPYFSFSDLAVVKLGGSNPQGVSQLVSRQGGRNYLLPSMPPKFASQKFPTISMKQTTIFNSTLQYYCRFGFRLLFDMIKAENNTVEQRDNRKDALDIILTLLFRFVRHIQTTMPAGWSKNAALNKAEQYWLDPKRGELDDESEFQFACEQQDWIIDLERSFAFWIISILENKFTSLRGQFSDPDFRECATTFHNAVKTQLRKKQGGL